VRVVTEIAEARPLLEAIHDRVRRTQVGDVNRPDGWWNAFFAGRTAGSGFFAFYEDAAGEVEGFASYRVRNDFVVPLQSDWTVVVQGLGALTFDAYVALWRFLWDLDLTATVVAHVRPPDEPLRHLLADPRRLRTTRAIDYLWCRVVDVGAALEARRYEVAGSVVLDVRDEFCPWNAGRWRLEGGPDGASCSRTSDDADLTLSTNELGATFLGGTRLSALAAARRVDEHATGAVARTDSMLAMARAPWCQSNF
jgi:predicted acetyltransferase